MITNETTVAELKSAAERLLKPMVNGFLTRAEGRHRTEMPDIGNFVKPMGSFDGKCKTMAIAGNRVVECDANISMDGRSRTCEVVNGDDGIRKIRCTYVPRDGCQWVENEGRIMEQCAAESLKQ